MYARNDWRTRSRSEGLAQRNIGGSTDSRFGRGGPAPRSARNTGAINSRTNKRAPRGPEISITSDLQVTDGKLRGRLLQNSLSPRGTPTCRHLREQMFRVLAKRVRAGRFLDLCAGCGTIGIEAISRGAMLATFVECSSRMASHLRNNLKEAGVHENRGQVVEIEAVPYLNRCSRRGRVWDVVYLGRLDGEPGAQLIELLGRGRIIARGGVVVIEHSSDSALSETLGVLKQWRTIEKDGTSLSFYNRYL